jgi:hypothetical protein
VWIEKLTAMKQVCVSGKLLMMFYPGEYDSTICDSNDILCGYYFAMQHLSYQNPNPWPVFIQQNYLGPGASTIRAVL